MAGFRANGGNLIRLGMLWVVGMFVVVLLIFAVGIPTPPGTIKTVPEMADWLRGSRWVLGCGHCADRRIRLYVSILWFAVPVNHLHGLKPMESIRWSGFALWYNMGTMLGLCSSLVVMFVALFVTWAAPKTVSCPSMDVRPIGRHGTGRAISYRQVFATQDPIGSSRERCVGSSNPV